MHYFFEFCCLLENLTKNFWKFLFRLLSMGCWIGFAYFFCATLEAGFAVEVSRIRVGVRVLHALYIAWAIWRWCDGLFYKKDFLIEADSPRSNF